MKIIETERLILRTWQKEDKYRYFSINQDEKVLQFLPKALSMDMVDSFIEHMNQQQKDKNYTLWAVELKNTNEMIGFIGLNYTTFAAHFTPAVEVGWRLASKHWGQGYAPEGAKACLEYGFTLCGLKEIVSFTVPANKNSIRVMEKIGMIKDEKGNFRHPNLPLEHRLSEHVLYRIKK